MAIQTSNTYPSDAQIKFAFDLLAKKDLVQSTAIVASANRQRLTVAQEAARYRNLIELGRMTRKQVSAMIDHLLSLPNKPVQQRDTTNTDAWQPRKLATGGDNEAWFMSKLALNVPRGSYGLETPGSQFTNDITFFSVWISDDGSRWTVRMYVSDERVKLPRSLQYQILDAIAQDPAEAAACYGHNIGKCGICHRKLTNDDSRARGIGPICAANFGW